MSTARPIKNEGMKPSHREILVIFEELHQMLDKMKKKESFCPLVQELDKYAQKIDKFLKKHHKEIESTRAPLNTAIIDLTEIPLMHPQMQRVAIQTALKVACENIEKFCQKTY